MARETYAVVRTMFNVEAKDVLVVVARAKTINGDVYVKTITRGPMADIQFHVPASILENTSYFVAINGELFPEASDDPTT